ncbi:Aldose 1-dehydrogenase (NAD(P)(+)) [Micromonospora saelicesensis]|uniref:Aldose 1-dehydrogenase (NAD(P)(+)) n=1 Tax=Micromonospora saelicesensis TaxID=285676 RepID=A0A328NN61_9ACTN|nr:alcohol dehydrogenase catalytic domain-containing protein [Micromonospora saelicesensis]RAO29978.1 Aldose 1-dehydrogenase (NAD(P)(+)) [Micromonospora saelicesensis]
MRAVVLTPGATSPLLTQWAEPEATENDNLLQTVEVGICGTDALLLEGIEGAPPAGEEALVLGHEGLARVVTPARDGRFRVGDLVVSAVRWPDPKPCEACAAGRPDLCLSEGWTEHGIRGRHGFMVDRWTADSARLVHVPAELKGTAVLVEPLSVVINLLEKLRHSEQARLGRGQVAVVIGAGPIGILTACMLTLEGRAVLLADRLDREGRRGRTAAGLGIDYLQVSDLLNDTAFRHRLREADVVVEAAGATAAVLLSLVLCRANGTVAVLGTGQAREVIDVDTNEVASELVQHNKAIIGSVNASFTHVQASIGALQEITSRWPGVIEAMIDRYPPSELSRAMSASADTYVKSAISFE